MPLVSSMFSQPAAFDGLPLGTVFQFEGLRPYQVCIKVEAPSRSAEPWILLLGGGTSGPYPSPWYGAMEDVRDLAVFPLQVGVTIGPTGPPVSRSAMTVVLPGDLCVRRFGGFGILIEGRLCIEPVNGERFHADVSPDLAYASWAMKYVEAGVEKVLFQYPIPEGIVAR